MNDCFKAVTNFVPFSTFKNFISKKELFKISKELTCESVPTIININSLDDYESFKRWGMMFKPNHIDTVCISIEIPDRRLNFMRYTIDYVPACVKNVEILKFDYICPFTFINLPDTVESLSVHKTMATVLRLPVNIKHLCLGYHFIGIVLSFTSNLKTVELYGYHSGSQNPCPIDSLPDTIQTMKICSDFPAFIEHWPVNVQLFIENQYDNPYDDHSDDLQLLFWPNHEANDLDEDYNFEIQEFNEDDLQPINLDMTLYNVDDL
jgi:hypothetical protein